MKDTLRIIVGQKYPVPTCIITDNVYDYLRNTVFLMQ